MSGTSLRPVTTTVCAQPQPSCKKCRANSAGGSCSSCAGRGDTFSSVPSLTSELALIVERHTQSPPPEIYDLFPKWAQELPEILHTQTASQLRAAQLLLDIIEQN